MLIGVNDNGSGMAAMLEAARILAKSKFSDSCRLLNSIAFVAFDWEESVSITNRVLININK